MAAAEKKKREITDDDEDDEKGNAEPVEKKGSKLTLIVILLLILIILAGGGAAAYFLFLKQPPATEGKKTVVEAKPQVAVFYPMTPFIVNLLDNEGERYLKVVLQLELSNEKMVEEIKLINPKLRDTILDLLSSKTYREMMDPLGKQRLRDEIIMRVNANVNMDLGKVQKVYFTEFVIQ